MEEEERWYGDACVGGTGPDEHESVPVPEGGEDDLRPERHRPKWVPACWLPIADPPVRSGQGRVLYPPGRGEEFRPPSVDLPPHGGEGVTDERGGSGDGRERVARFSHVESGVPFATARSPRCQGCELVRPQPPEFRLVDDPSVRVVEQEVESRLVVSGSGPPRHEACPKSEDGRNGRGCGVCRPSDPQATACRVRWDG